jgi:hypothetical protein
MGNDDELQNFAARLEAEWMKDAEPVAWITGGDCYADGHIDCYAWTAGEFTTPLYLHPAPKESQEPVAWINDKLPHMTVRIKPHEGGNWVPVFHHPAPIPPGYVLVPEEPTEAMCQAASAKCHHPQALYKTAYKAMLAAAKGEV